MICIRGAQLVVQNYTVWLNITLTDIRSTGVNSVKGLVNLLKCLERRVFADRFAQRLQVCIRTLAKDNANQLLWRVDRGQVDFVQHKHRVPHSVKPILKVFVVAHCFDERLSQICKQLWLLVFELV